MCSGSDRRQGLLLVGVVSVSQFHRGNLVKREGVNPAMSLPKSNPLDIVSAHQTMSERLGEAASQARSALRQGISKFKRTRTFDGQPATIASSYVDMLVAAEEKWEPAYIR